jgi:hypothetical protein
VSDDTVTEYEESSQKLSSESDESSADVCDEDFVVRKKQTTKKNGTNSIQKNKKCNN